MSKITFYIARHGKTLMNTLDRVQGWCDSPLTQEGIDIAKALGRGLKHISFRSAYCSDLRRTLETTRLVLDSAGQKDISITQKFGFREACFGGFEADFNGTMWGNAALYLHYTSLEKMYEALAKKELSYDKVLDAVSALDKMGIAENFSTLETRTHQALTEIAEKESKEGEGNILIIAHGMSILGMLYNLGGKDILEKPLDNAAVCKVTYQDGKFTVESMSDMSYVENGKTMR